MRRMRLDRLLTRTGVTRSEASKLIREGRVRVAGKAVTDAALSVDLDEQSVTLDGKAVRTDEHFYIMLNKPAELITAVEDKRQDTVMKCLTPEIRAWNVAPVGRLDKDVTGLLLLTDDGELAHRLISPRWEQPKRYIALVEGRIGAEDIAKAERGIELNDMICKSARLEPLRASGGDTLCALTISEGKFHQVKRMMAALGHPVLRLKRESMGSLTLDENLSEGQWRELTPDEVAALYSAVELRS